VGEGGQGAFAGGVEEAFCEEAGFELVEGLEEGAGAAELEGFGDELELAARLVDGDGAAGADFVAVFGAEAKEGGLAAEEDDGELGFAVFEGEVEVAGGCGAEVGDLAFYGYGTVLGFDLGADLGDEGSDGVDGFRGWGWWSKRLGWAGVRRAFLPRRRLAKVGGADSSGIRV
jgi:hypothetical protein